MEDTNFVISVAITYSFLEFLKRVMRFAGMKVKYKYLDGRVHECEILSVNGYYPPTGEQHYTLKDLVTEEIINSAWEKDRK